ncbi:MAG TPA: hypothetical protein VFR24_27455 [Candidatus Angelobacter sp.]|nr:hypothetical protein [Candidatus Angelobacter sp.]
MTRYVYRPDHPSCDEFGMVEASIAGPKHESDNAAYVITDEMPALRHMADGKHYTSKAKFRQATKAAGCIEIGEETKTVLAPRQRIELSRSDRRDSIRKAIYELRNR